MNRESISRLSQIETLWSVVRQAHGQENSLAISAQQQLLDIYGGAIKRYLHASLKDPMLSDDLFQEFAVKFIKGDFRHADPDRGRFRFYVKRVVHNLVREHYRKANRRREQELGERDIESSQQPDENSEDELFLASWRDDLLEKTWTALNDHEQSTTASYYTVLKTRVEEPTLSSKAFAERLSQKLGNDIAPGAARVNLHRARDKFAKLMIETIAASLENPDQSAIESELIDLGLIDYCREALDAAVANVEATKKLE